MTTYQTCSKRLLHWSLVVFAGAMAYCGQHPVVWGSDPQVIQEVQFRGIRPSDEGGRNGLRNPERGLRIETLIAEPPGKPAWGPAAHLRGKTTSGYSDDWWILDAQRYESHGLTLAQTYCYLDDYIDAPIPEVKLQWLQAAFDNLRKSGLKTVLRFAYERDMTRKRGPNLPRILAHVDQLEEIVRRNVDVIFVMQAGFVGAWGEWHASAHHIETDHAALAAIVKRVLTVLPPDRMTQVRVPKYKRWVLEQPPFGDFEKVAKTNAHSGVPAARIGYHNDGFLARNTDGGTWPEPPHFASPGNPEFDYMTDESPHLAVDGELFWSDQGGKIDGLRAAVRLRLHHYSSFSLAHSFSEREGKPYSIDDWMKTPLTIEQARGARLPFSEDYFLDSEGDYVPRTQFEYIRDHLGYRLELQKAKLPVSVKAGRECAVEVQLINRGFSTLHNPRPVYLVLISHDGSVLKFKAEEADPRQWQPFAPGDRQYTPLVHTVSVAASLPADVGPGRYKIGLWMPDAAESLAMDPRYAIRVANAGVPWWTDTGGKYGINVIGSCEVLP
jgi:hypothetical protein